MNITRISHQIQSFSPSTFKLACRFNSNQRDRRFMNLVVDEDDENGLKKMPNPNADIEERINKSKQKLIWRKPFAHSQGFLTDMFRIFAPERTSVTYTDILTHRIDWSYKGMKKDFTEKKKEYEILQQVYISDRHRILGNNLAAAHFLIFRGGQIRFTNSREWLKRNELDEYDLPAQFNPNYLVNGLICDGLKLYYEGLENIRRLNQLKYLSMKDNALLDDWCLDRLAGNELNALEVLDVSGSSITSNGLVAIPKLLSLKYLIIDNIKRSTEFELSCLLLEECCPILRILDTNDELAKTIKEEYEDRPVEFQKLE